MKISKNGLDIIKKYEGCRLTAYKCPAGVLTIGYGHTGKVDGKVIVDGMNITQAKANELLKEDCEKFEKKVDAYAQKYVWTQNEFDALVSFAFNVGSIEQLTAGGTREKSVIAEKIVLYNKAAGKELAGLTKRRKEEQELFLKRCKVGAVSYKTTANLNCRDYPSTGGKILGVFAKGTKITYSSKSGDWYKVKGKATSGKTITGYCNSKYLKKV